MSRRVRRRGNCYAASEALYHLLGGKKSGWIPQTVRHEGEVHWYLIYRGKDGVIVIDPTARQFRTLPDYAKGRGRGFLTKKPSAKARKLMETMTWQSPVVS